MNPYERKKSVFTPEFIRELHESNRRARFRRYPQLEEMERLLVAMPEPSKIVQIRGKK